MLADQGIDADEVDGEVQTLSTIWLATAQWTKLKPGEVNPKTGRKVRSNNAWRNKATGQVKYFAQDPNKKADQQEEKANVKKSAQDTFNQIVNGEKPSPEDMGPGWRYRGGLLRRLPGLRWRYQG